MSSQQNKITGVLCLALLEQLIGSQSIANPDEFCCPIINRRGLAPRKQVSQEFPLRKVGMYDRTSSQRQDVVP